MKLILLFIISFFTINASAAVYKCTDSHGKKEYRPSPCVESSANAEINLKTGNIIDLDAEEKQKRLKREEEEQRLAKERLAMEQAELKKKTLALAN